MRRRGRLVVVEGLDGAGKSTVVRALAAALDAEVGTTPSPDLRAVREAAERALARDPLAVRLFYAASVLAAAAAFGAVLDAGRDVVLDRYWLSTLAWGRLEGLDLAVPLIEDHLVPADATLILDASDRERARRIGRRGEASGHDRVALDPAHARRLRAVYRDLARHPLAGRTAWLDTTELDPEAAGRAAVARVRSLLARRPRQGVLPVFAEEVAAS